MPDLSDQPPEFWQGIDQFNQGQYYACHDTLEAIWMEADESDKKFYQGILQIAVALYHLGNRNWRGAMILLGEGLHRLSGYQPDYAGINVEKLVTETVHLLKTVQQASPEELAAITAQLQSTTANSQTEGTIALPTIQKIA